MTRRCAACERSEPFPKLYERLGFQLVRCPGCGLVFQHPPPAREAYERIYYHDEDFVRRLETGDMRETAEGRARDKLSLLWKAEIRPPGRLLDIGCSTGAWLAVARGAGWEGQGIEVGEAAAEAARRRGFAVQTGTLEGALPALEGERFELVTLWDVLEHLEDPAATLAMVRSLLAPDGVVALTCPNVEGLYPRVTLRLLARRYGVWEHPELPAHLYDFSPGPLRLTFERAGLAVGGVTTLAIPFEHLREPILADQLRGRRRGRVLRGAFEALHPLIYPVARALDKGNAMFAWARPAPAE